MSSQVTKSPLDFNDYAQYEIDQAYQAYVIEINDLESEDAEDLEYEYMQQGYKIFASEMIRQSNGKLTLKLVLAKSGAIFNNQT